MIWAATDCRGDRKHVHTTVRFSRWQSTVDAINAKVNQANKTFKGIRWQDDIKKYWAISPLSAMEACCKSPNLWAHPADNRQPFWRCVLPMWESGNGWYHMDKLPEYRSGAALVSNCKISCGIRCDRVEAVYQISRCSAASSISFSCTNWHYARYSWTQTQEAVASQNVYAAPVWTKFSMQIINY